MILDCIDNLDQLLAKYRSNSISYTNKCLLYLTKEDVIAKRKDDQQKLNAYYLNVVDPDNLNKKSKYIPKNNIVGILSYYGDNNIINRISYCIRDTLIQIGIPENYIKLNESLEGFIKDKKIYAYLSKKVVNDFNEITTYIGFAIYGVNPKKDLDLIKNMSTTSTYGFISDFIDINMDTFISILDVNISKVLQE